MLEERLGRLGVVRMVSARRLRSRTAPRPPSMNGAVRASRSLAAIRPAAWRMATVASAASVCAWRGPVMKDQELVPALPSDDVAGARHAPQPRGDLDQEPVADRVAEIVVDQLEVVEIGEEHGGGRTAAIGRGDRRRQVLMEQRPVGEVGEGVVEGQVRQSLLGLLPRGHVEDRPVEELDIAGRVEDPATALVHPAHRLVGVHQPVLEDERLAPVERFADPLLDHHAVIRMDDARECAHARAHELGRRMPRDDLDLVADEPHCPVALGRAAIDRPGHVRDQRLEAVRVRSRRR